jgi:hypothetical protein
MLSPTTQANDLFKYSQPTGSVTIDKTDFPDTKALLPALRITCPADGYVLAQANAGILLAPVAGSSDVQGGISLTTDNSAPYAADPNHYYSIVQSSENGTNNAVLPVFIERVVTCTQGKTVTLRFVAWHESAGAASTALLPRMVMQFFPK